ncbi:outer membrane lipoprotein chaperone LolA [Candidatus Latescibacterota bacterium]
MKYFSAFLLATAVMMSCGSALCAVDDADKIIKNVEKTLKKLKTVTCSFEQVIYQKVADRNIRRNGKIWMKDPNLLRVEDPNKQVVVDGRTVWMYVPRNKQVQVSTFIQGDAGFPTPMSLFERYSESRQAEHIGSEEVNGEMCDILLLVSSVQSELPVKVWIENKRDFLVKTLEEMENGDTVEYVLSDIVLNEKIDDDVFVFVAPDGVETIDLRE